MGEDHLCTQLSLIVVLGRCRGQEDMNKVMASAATASALWRNAVNEATNLQLHVLPLPPRKLTVHRHWKTTSAAFSCSHAQWPPLWKPGMGENIHSDRKWVCLHAAQFFEPNTTCGDVASGLWVRTLPHWARNGSPDLHGARRVPRASPSSPRGRGPLEEY